ncbi:hypothetical protein B0H17DRAFT_1183244 [Mycena rosella]|uniref:Uncharacterized protein n=1 Tax=Mycena rosella TaxID=1033263 RepID=A0AAD7D0W0_MYCRO|nr:hypothetical protein B0H17DRAFT_1183244 [Mycena rosella]
MRRRAAAENDGGQARCSSVSSQRRQMGGSATRVIAPSSASSGCGGDGDGRGQAQRGNVCLCQRSQGGQRTGANAVRAGRQRNHCRLRSRDVERTEGERGPSSAFLGRAEDGRERDDNVTTVVSVLGRLHSRGVERASGAPRQRSWGVQRTGASVVPAVTAVVSDLGRLHSRGMERASGRDRHARIIALVCALAASRHRGVQRTGSQRTSISHFSSLTDDTLTPAPQVHSQDVLASYAFYKASPRLTRLNTPRLRTQCAASRTPGDAGASAVVASDAAPQRCRIPRTSAARRTIQRYKPKSPDPRPPARTSTARASLGVDPEPRATRRCRGDREAAGKHVPQAVLRPSNPRHRPNLGRITQSRAPSVPSPRHATARAACTRTHLAAVVQDPRLLMSKSALRHPNIDARQTAPRAPRPASPQTPNSNAPMRGSNSQPGALMDSLPTCRLRAFSGVRAGGVPVDARQFVLCAVDVTYCEAVNTSSNRIQSNDLPDSVFRSARSCEPAFILLEVKRESIQGQDTHLLGGQVLAGGGTVCGIVLRSSFRPLKASRRTMVVEGTLGRHSDVGHYYPGPIETALSPLTLDHLYSMYKTFSEKSPRVYYQREWACLNSTCSSFWIGLSGRALPDQLEHNPEILAVIDFRLLPHAFQDSLLPKPPMLGTISMSQLQRRYTRVSSVPDCCTGIGYKCNCRDRPAKTLMSIRVPISGKFADSLIDPWSGAIGRYQIFILTEKKYEGVFLPGILNAELTHNSLRGKIHLMQTNGLTNVEADRIFKAYQRQASDGTLLFRGWPLRSHKRSYQTFLIFVSTLIRTSQSEAPFSRTTFYKILAKLTTHIPKAFDNPACVHCTYKTRVEFVPGRVNPSVPHFYTSFNHERVGLNNADNTVGLELLFRTEKRSIFGNLLNNAKSRGATAFTEYYENINGNMLNRVLANECDKFDESKPPSRVTSPPTAARARRPLKIQESRCDFKHRSLKFEAWLDLAGSRIKILQDTCLRRIKCERSLTIKSVKLLPHSQVWLHPTVPVHGDRDTARVDDHLVHWRPRQFRQYTEKSWRGRAHFLLTGVIHVVVEAETEHNEWAKVKQVAQTRVIEVVDGSW